MDEMKWKRDGRVSVDLVEQECYFDVPLSEEQQEPEQGTGANNTTNAGGKNL